MSNDCSFRSEDYPRVAIAFRRPTEGGAVSPPPADVPDLGWPLTGRVAEIEAFARALALPGCAAVVLYGQAGVGKSSLAEAFLARAESEGHPTARVLASAAAATMPLGALAPILPADADASASSAPGALFEAARQAMVALGPSTPVVLVDDAHNLDLSSAVLLTQLIAAGVIMVVATIRDGEEVPDVVSGWWRSRDALRFDVGELSRTASGAVLEAFLSGPVGADTVLAFHEASGGNPLVLRELVHHALVEGRLQSDTGTWRLLGPLPASRRLADLLKARLAALTPEARAILNQLALCAPLGLRELTGQVSSAEVEALERAGLVREVVDGFRHQLVLAHPLYGEVLRADMMAIGRQRILLAVADATVALGTRRREDARRVATWRLDGGGDPDPALLRHAAIVARNANDFRGVERLATYLRRVDSTVESAVLLGEALYELGDFVAAEAVLAEPAPGGATPLQLAQRAGARAKNLQWGLCDWPKALDVVREARAEAGPEVADLLLAVEGAVRLFSGQPQLALDVVAEIRSPTPGIAVQIAIDRSTALALVGRPLEAIEVAERAFAEHLALAEPAGLAHPGTHVVNQAFGLIEAGRFGEAHALSQAGYEIAVADRIPVAQIWFAIMLGKIELLRGHLGDSRGWYREGASTARLHGFRGPLRLAVAGEAVAEAQLGNASSAATAIEELDSLPEFAFLAHDQAIGRAWASWAGGQPAAARAILLAEADRAAEASNRASAAWLWHDAARMGAKGLGGCLGELARASDSALISVRAVHAAALDSGDPEALADSSRQLEALGKDLVAAEAAGAAADAFRRAGDQRSGAREAGRRDALAAACQGAATPGLASIDAPVPLSSREREIATLASQGLASREIAERLFLSVRTVDNHLQRVYSKLGLTGREQLASALGPL